jgi:uncharacterized protein (TIGR03435 family)
VRTVIFWLLSKLEPRVNIINDSPRASFAEMRFLPRLVLVTCLLVAMSARGQGADRLTFDVISIKPSPADAFDTRLVPMPGGQTYQARNMSVKYMFSFLFRVPMQRLTGGPAWLNDTRWDIDAKATHSYGLDDLHRMFQNLLLDEFNLTFHKENKEGSVYALLIDKSGLKMKADTSAEELTSPITHRLSDGSTIGKRVPINYLCWWLMSSVDRDAIPVIDETGLQGFYDFTLKYLPELPPGYDMSKLPPGMADLPSIFTALREQLGLKLEAKKGPVEIYVFDAARKPSSI